MNSLVQTLNQYSFVILCLLLWVGVAVVLVRKRVKTHWWGVWGSVAILLMAVIILFRTPMGAVYRVSIPLDNTADPPNQPTANPLIGAMPQAPEPQELRHSFLSDAEIDDFPALVRSDERLYTLVEFYSDFGIG